MPSLLEFNNPKLLQQALTHRSYVKDHPAEEDNERLEFLGDALLNYLSGDYLYRTDPNVGEDVLTRRRSALVDEFQLAQFALVLGLEQKIRLGHGVQFPGSSLHHPSSPEQSPNQRLLSSAFEAIVGAYYLDQQRDIEAVRPLVEAFFRSVSLEQLQQRSLLDPKGRFQTWVQTHTPHQLPEYVYQRLGGPDHQPTYRAQVFVADRCYGEGQGRTKKKAAQQAATQALKNLNLLEE